MVKTGILRRGCIGVILVLISCLALAGADGESADLGLTSVDLQPYSSPGGPYIGSITVANNGGMIAMSRPVTFYLSEDSQISPDDYAIGSLKFSFLRPGETACREILGTIPENIPPGTYTSGAILGTSFNLTPDPESLNDKVSGNLVTINSTYTRPQEWINNKIADLVFNYTNTERNMRQIKSLVRDERLDIIAGEHSRDMAKRNFFDHTNPDGEEPVDRAARHGYQQSKTLPGGLSYYGIGENIVKIPVDDNVYGFGDIGGDDPDQIAQVAIESFMDSPSHKKALLLPLHEKIGIGVAFDGKYYYVTQNFF